MTTREEYAEAAKWIQTWQVDCAEPGMVPTPYSLAIRVLWALADGAVLCHGEPVAWGAVDPDGDVWEADVEKKWLELEAGAYEDKTCTLHRQLEL